MKWISSTVGAAVKVGTLVNISYAQFGNVKKQVSSCKRGLFNAIGTRATFKNRDLSARASDRSMPDM